jgi:(p)ppGpp synthase/HD superfamily hydrolase
MCIEEKPLLMLTPRFSQALVYAVEAHDGQTRKGTSIPYVAHVLAVASLALENGANEDEAIAALLHDVVEDCGGLPRLADLRERFGESVASIVMGCTDSTETPKPPWKERKQAYIHHLDAASPSALLVSACDKLHNVRSLLVSVRNDGDAGWSRFKGGKDGTLWYYRAVLDGLKRCGTSPRLMHELEISLEELHRAVDSKVPLSDVHFPDV